MTKLSKKVYTCSEQSPKIVISRHGLKTTPCIGFFSILVTNQNLIVNFYTPPNKVICQHANLLNIKAI